MEGNLEMWRYALERERERERLQGRQVILQGAEVL